MLGRISPVGLLCFTMVRDHGISDSRQVISIESYSSHLFFIFFSILFNSVQSFFPDYEGGKYLLHGVPALLLIESKPLAVGERLSRKSLLTYKRPILTRKGFKGRCILPKAEKREAPTAARTKRKTDD